MAKRGFHCRRTRRRIHCQWGPRKRITSWWSNRKCNRRKKRTERWWNHHPSVAKVSL